MRSSSTSRKPARSATFPRTPSTTPRRRSRPATPPVSPRIQAILANAKDASESDQDLIVSIGSTVALVDADGEVTEVTLVGTTETNSLQHKISNESPVGRAIIGHGAGETVEVVTPSGASRVYTITKISR